MQRKKLLIFPYNGNGIEALDCIDESVYDFIGFIDDDPDKLNSKNIHPVYTRKILEKFPEAGVLAVPGSAVSYLKRESHINSLLLSADRFVSIIHPSASLGKSVKIGMNCLIMAGVVITSNAIIGNNVCILPNTVIHHDAVIEDFSLIGSNVVIAGGTKVGINCYIGSGSNIINGISVGSYSMIGLGTNLIKGTGDNARFAGNPGKSIIQ